MSEKPFELQADTSVTQNRLPLPPTSTEPANPHLAVHAA